MTLPLQKLKTEARWAAAEKQRMMRDNQIKALQSEHSLSSGVISRFKDQEKQHRSKIINLEKQLAEFKSLQTLAANQKQHYHTRLAEAVNSTEGLQKQVDQLSAALKEKDQAVSEEFSNRRKAEKELEKTNVKLESVERTLKTLSKENSDNSTLDTLRVSLKPLYDCLVAC